MTKDYEDNEKKLIRLAKKLKDELRKLAIAIDIATASRRVVVRVSSKSPSRKLPP